MHIQRVASPQQEERFTHPAPDPLTLEQHVKAHPVVQEVIRLFDAQIVEIQRTSSVVSVGTCTRQSKQRRKRSSWQIRSSIRQ